MHGFEGQYGQPHPVISEELGKVHTLEELRIIVPTSIAQEIDTYQRGMLEHPRNLIAEPLPSDIIRVNPKGAEILLNNLIPYNGDIKAAIGADPVMQMLKKAQEYGQSKADLPKARRCRRSIVALVFEVIE